MPRRARTRAKWPLHRTRHAAGYESNNQWQYWGGRRRGDSCAPQAPSSRTISSRCDGRHLRRARLSRCKQLLSAAPGSYNEPEQGSANPAVQSLSVNPGRTQRTLPGSRTNGRSRPRDRNVVCPQTSFGDGGLPAQTATEPALRSNRTHTEGGGDFNERRSANWDGSPNRSSRRRRERRGSSIPIHQRPTVHGALFVGSPESWRTTMTADLGVLDQHCKPVQPGDFAFACVVAIGRSSATTSTKRRRLTCRSRNRYADVPVRPARGTRGRRQRQLDRPSLAAQPVVGPRRRQGRFHSKNGTRQHRRSVVPRIDSTAGETRRLEPVRCISRWIRATRTKNSSRT